MVTKKSLELPVLALEEVVLEDGLPFEPPVLLAGVVLSPAVLPAADVLGSPVAAVDTDAPPVSFDALVLVSLFIV
jgi:hypothetical protein